MCIRKNKTTIRTLLQLRFSYRL
uniref:Uncharacterized protein n=1 Tax=Anguilla anguilla TaxID=7936 RepID=A0A0E9VYE9_ANGAN